MIDDRTVLVWRRAWLAPSETFIANQTAALREWRPVLAGRTALPGGLLQPHVLVPRGGGVAKQAAAFAAMAGDNPPQLVHAHFGDDALDVLPLTRKLGLPLVVTFHGFDATQHSLIRSPSKTAYRLRLPRVFRYATKVIAVSEFIASQVVELGAPADRTVVCPIGVPDRARLREYDPDGPITFVGRFVDKKGIRDLLDAVSRLPMPYRNRRVELIGYGPLERDLREQARRARLNVAFLGRLDPDEVAAALSRSAVFCAPSKTAPNGDAEGFGMVFLEAAQQGVPVVAYRHGGVAEAVADGRTGLLADEGDVDGLAKHLHAVLSYPDHADNLGSAGRQRVQSEFLISDRTRALEAVYDQTVAAGQRTRELR